VEFPGVTRWNRVSWQVCKLQIFLAYSRQQQFQQYVNIIQKCNRMEQQHFVWSWRFSNTPCMLKIPHVGFEKKISGMFIVTDTKYLFFCPYPTPHTFIVSVGFIGGGNWRTRRKPPTCRKSLTNIITWCCTPRLDRDSNSHISGDRHWLQDIVNKKCCLQTGNHNMIFGIWVHDHKVVCHVL
jgi:hypothetical protein